MLGLVCFLVMTSLISRKLEKTEWVRKQQGSRGRTQWGCRRESGYLPLPVVGKKEVVVRGGGGWRMFSEEVPSKPC